MIKVCTHQIDRRHRCYKKVDITYLDPEKCKIYIFCEEHLPEGFKELYEAINHSNLTKEEWAKIIRKKLGIMTS